MNASERFPLDEVNILHRSADVPVYFVVICEWILYLLAQTMELKGWHKTAEQILKLDQSHTSEFSKSEQQHYNCNSITKTIIKREQNP